MSFLKSTLHASVFAALSLLGTEKVLAQSYSLLNVTTEGPSYNARCMEINNNGTVVCAERDYVGLNFQDRITFDNPFFSSTGTARDVPTISAFPVNSIIQITGINMGSVVVGQTIEGSIGRPFAYSAVSRIPLDPLAILPAPSDTVQFNGVVSVNDQGWMVLSSSSSTGHANYLRVPSSSDLNSGVSYPITCSGQPGLSLPVHVNRNGLIAGSCIGARGRTAVVWGWWDLNNPVDLAAYLPTTVDLGTGLIHRTSDTFGSCEAKAAADTTDVVLVECQTRTRTVPAGSDARAQFVVSASGSRQVDRSIDFVEAHVNSQGCVVGWTLQTIRGYSQRAGIVDCGKGARLLSQLDGVGKGMNITSGLDINDQGHILAFGYFPTPGYVVLAPR